MTPTTETTPAVSSEPTVKLRKVRAGGFNYDFGRFVERGEEVEASLDLAARCIMGREFELLDEADRPRVEAALRELTGESPTPTDPGELPHVEAPTDDTADHAIPPESLSFNDDAPTPTAPSDDTPAESDDPGESPDPSEPQPLDPADRHSTR